MQINFKSILRVVYISQVSELTFGWFYISWPARDTRFIPEVNNCAGQDVVKREEREWEGKNEDRERERDEGGQCAERISKQIGKKQEKEGKLK